MKTSSCKGKGRRLQDYVRDTLRLIFKDKLENDDIKSAIMGTSGVDIVLSPAGKKLIPFAFECKNQEKLNVNKALLQAESNAKQGIPILVFKKNRSKTYVAMEYDDFLKIVYNIDIEKLKNDLILLKKPVILQPNSL